MTQVSIKTKVEVSALKDSSIEYLMSLWDSASGGFRFASHQPATLMATAYTVIGLEFLQGLVALSKGQRTAIIGFLSSGVQADGSFTDPLFCIEDIHSSQHTIAYFQEETTTFCQQALDALSAPPPPPHNWKSDWRTVNNDIVSYLESLSWQNPWLDSNPVMFLLSQLCHDAERHQQLELLKMVDTALDWLDTNQSAETGLWQGPYPVSLTNAMATTFHFTFFYIYRCRTILHAERIIDSCLKLQQPHGLFSGKAIGQTCLDYDALDLLAKVSLTTNYRSDDVQQAMVKAQHALLDLHNPAGGGFADCKERLSIQKGRKAKILRKLGLKQLIPSSKRIAAQGEYHVCWRLLTCDTAQSNAFSTWFRHLGLRLATQDQWIDSEVKSSFLFRRLPFLGYHNPLMKVSEIH